MKKKIEHIAIIMDGNGRWAKKNKLSTFLGHQTGVDRIEDVVKTAIQNDVKYVTIYAFSKENWGRSQEEVSGLLKLIKLFYKNKTKTLLKEGVKINILGARQGVPSSTLKILDDIVLKSKDNDCLILNIAFNYSSQDEILDAVNKLLEKNVKNVTKEQFENELYTSGMPDVDLLIRTSGEQRISNFLLWQISYSELLFSKTLWPEFNSKEFQKCIDEYYLRDRRFGKR